MSKRFAKLRSTLETQNWKSVVALFRKWPEEEERETALQYTANHLASWSPDECVAAKVDKHPCWSLVTHWKLKTFGDGEQEILRNSPHIRVLSFPSKILNSVLDFLKDCPQVTHLRISGRLHLVPWQKLFQLPHLQSLQLEQLTAINLGGFEVFENLKELRILEAELLEDISALRSCNSLEALELRNVRIESLEDLRELTELREIRVNFCNRGLELEPLTGLHKLEILNFENCQFLGSLEPLEQLSGLREVNIQGANWIRSIQPLRTHRELRILNISWMNLMKSLEGIEELDKLTELNCNYTNAGSLAPLENKKHLRRLYLNAAVSKDVDPTPLASLTNLEELTLAHNTRMQPLPNLSGLTQLKTFYLGHTPIENFEFLQGATSIERMYADESPNLTSLSGMEGLTNLHTLSLNRCNQLSDFSALSSLTGLEILSITNNSQLQSTEYIAPLKKLKEVNLGLNFEIRESTLSLPALTCLRLTSAWKLEHIDLTGCNKLLELILSDCKVLKEIKGLGGASKLRMLFVNNCGELEDIEDFDKLPELKKSSFLHCHKLFPED